MDRAERPEMEIGGWVILAVLWALLNLMTKRQEKKPQRERPGAPRPGPRLKTPPLTHAPDATQQEGSRLEMVLREFERTLKEIPQEEEEEEEVEERQTLEWEPEAVSLETDVRREERRQVDHDDQAEQIVARRISAAAARDKAISKADHTAFDERIRQQPADKTATRYTARQLRDAVVWREILGPPVSLRSEETEE